MAVVADRPIEGEEPLDAFRHVDRAQDVRDRHIGSGMQEMGSSVIAGDVHVAVRVGHKAASKGREEGQGL